MYSSHPPHRNGTPHKSQWQISLVDEFEAFEFAENTGWLVGAEGWGLHLVDGKASLVGICAQGTEPLVFAKFVDGTATDAWHGYPGDQRKEQDIPPQLVSNDWMQKGLVQPAKLRKLIKGQKCRL